MIKTKANTATAREPTAPMTKSVLELLRRKGALTSLEAQGVLRCRQLPARVLELKRLGHRIVTELKVDPTGQKYARYHLQHL
ncbi:helix-turn-helix domain-containing protein [Mesorhizobium sp. M0243]|uniref:helix-turn-helix domain-containing protein n=1 Tax=Mesorhizobium sp. M0243 TaxID=2956925 RepID=UPI003335016C